jgi:hypothetical protein
MLHGHGFLMQLTGGSDPREREHAPATAQEHGNRLNTALSLVPIRTQGIAFH